MNNYKIFIISGPSGSGKTSILKRVFHNRQVRKAFFRVPTVTTRNPRPAERDGADYKFVDKHRFLELKERGYFLETKQYLNDFYGTPNDFLKEAEEKKSYPILCIDVEGMQKVTDIYPDRTTSIFILPPSGEILERRLQTRQTESVQKLKKRLRIAKKEVKYATKYDYQVMNYDLDKTTKEIIQIISKEADRKI